MIMSLKRAREIHEIATQALQEEGLSKHVRTNAKAAQATAALAIMAYRFGRRADGAEALALAERAWRDATTQHLAPDAARGARSMVGSHTGAKKRAALNSARDVEMAQDFLRRRPGSKMSDSALKADIGKEKGIKRSASIAAIDRGLEALGK